jgi:hypothetical protein
MSSAFESNFAMLPYRINLRTAVKYQQAVVAWFLASLTAATRKTLVWRVKYAIFPALHKVLVVWHSAC